MTIKVMYFSYQPYFLNLAKEMKKEGWQPVYWSVDQNVKFKIKSQYPNVICHNHFDAIKGIPPEEYAMKKLSPLCPLMLKKLAIYERNALRMFERNDSHTNTFSHRERVDLYKYLVQYWENVLVDLKPKYVVFEEEPHQASDYILYAVCQILEIETIMFIRTKFHERMYPVKKFEEGSNIILAAYYKQLAEDNVGIPNLSSSMKKYFSDLQGSYDKAISIHLYDQIEEVKGMRANKFKFFIATKILIMNLYLKFNINDMIKRWQLLVSSKETRFFSDQKQKKKSFKDSNLTYLEHVYYKFKSILKKKVLKRFYQSVVDNSYDLNKPYIFCALHYQPEKTTCPLGGDFDDQIYMLSLLSKSLPKGWQLYVKDHPSQFVSSYTRYGEHFRSKNFYKTILELPNVRLLPLESDTFNLIDNSKAVASVTGTSSWEAVLRGVPAFVFGHCWFKHCKGVFYVDSYDSVKNVFDKIINGFEVNKTEVQLFAKVVEENSFKGVVGGPGLRKHFNITDDQNGIAHAAAIRAIIS